MVSQSPGIYILLGAITSGILLIINTSVNNKFQLDREQQQHIWQEKSEQQKWYREKIYDCYIRSIKILTKIIQEQFEIELSDMDDHFCDTDGNIIVTSHRRVNLAKLILEFRAELAIIEAGYPDKDSKEFQEKIVMINESLEKKPTIARVIITEMMEHDSRIKDANK